MSYAESNENDVIPFGDNCMLPESYGNWAYWETRKLCQRKQSRTMYWTSFRTLVYVCLFSPRAWALLVGGLDSSSMLMLINLGSFPYFASS